MISVTIVIRCYIIYSVNPCCMVNRLCYSISQNRTILTDLMSHLWCHDFCPDYKSNSNNIALLYTIGKLPEWYIWKKYITDKDKQYYMSEKHENYIVNLHEWYIFSVYVRWGMFYVYYPPFCTIYGLNNINI